MTTLKLWLYAQSLVLQQAWVLKVYPLPVVILPRNLKIMRGRRGFCMPFIFIAVRNGESFSGVREVIRHEMRHHWQTIYMYSLCAWWRKHTDLYRRYTKSPLSTGLSVMLTSMARDWILRSIEGSLFRRWSVGIRGGCCNNSFFVVMKCKNIEILHSYFDVPNAVFDEIKHFVTPLLRVLCFKYTT